MYLPDFKIRELALSGMIDPFVDHQVQKGVIGYGLSSFGYDIRLSAEDFRIFRHVPGEIVDPKNFNPAHLEQALLQEDETGQFFVLPGNSYALGVAYERINVPDDVFITCLGKSTYARVGVIANVTPAEPGWEGHLTLEFSNSANSDVKMYALEGCIQLIFGKSGYGACEVPYNARDGKYNNQTSSVVLPKVK